jgi:hypothetical protein
MQVLLLLLLLLLLRLLLLGDDRDNSVGTVKGFTLGIRGSAHDRG